jgi:2,3-bisphosphoglycerate-dependent phosphoglycerate mutase
MRRLLLIFLILLGVQPRHAVAQQKPVVVYLVRHAERGDDGTSDPPITAAGQERARVLANTLRDAGLTDIYTTDYKRTRSTVAPTAQETGLEPQVYDANELQGLATMLRAKAGRHLVVGHSDTTVDLVRALGGDPGGAIADGEYDRLYVLTLTPEGTTTVLLRYGAPYRP